MSTVLQQQLADIASVLGIEGKVEALQAKRQAERIEALTADLAVAREELVTAQGDASNSQARLDKVRDTEQKLMARVAEVEGQLSHALGDKSRASGRVNACAARVAELERQLEALGVESDA